MSIPAVPGRRLSCAVASPLALSAACVPALLALPDGSRSHAAPLLVALAMTLGVVQGLLWELAFALVARLPARMHGWIWTAASIAAAATLAENLGAFARWGSRYHALAAQTLVACSAGAIVFALLLSALQSSHARPLGRLLALPRKMRLSCALLLLLGAVALFFADRELFAGLYPSAHMAMRLACVWLGTFAIIVAFDGPRFLQGIRHRALIAIASVLVGLGVAERASAGAGALSIDEWPRALLEVSRDLTDLDRDGYSGLFAGGDCAALDPRVHPAMMEIPNNGIDENCLLGDATQRARTSRQTAMPTTPAPMDIVLITVDSLRADRMGTYLPAYGQRGFDTTPKIDAFARKAVVFERAITPGGWTAIAMSSLMRGVYARRIGWTRRYETNKYRLVPWKEIETLKDEWTTKMFALPRANPLQPTLAESLTRRGMHTVAVVDDEFSEMLSVSSGVAPGFERYIEMDSRPKAERNDAGTATLAIRTLAEMPKDKRFFFWVHFFGPHSPTRNRKDVRRDGKGLQQGYEHEIRYADREIGRLLSAIGARRQPTAVFITADHGEEFLGGQRHHGYSVADGAIHVPLIAKVPGWKTGRVKATASLVDLMPTILQLTGSPWPAELDGMPLDELRHPRAKSRFVVVDTWQHDRRGRLQRGATATVEGRNKATFDPLQNAWTLETYQNRTLSKRVVEGTSREPLVRALGGYLESSRGLDLTY